MQPGVRRNRCSNRSGFVLIGGKIVVLSAVSVLLVMFSTIGLCFGTELGCYGPFTIELNQNQYFFFNGKEYRDFTIWYNPDSDCIYINEEERCYPATKSYGPTESWRREAYLDTPYVKNAIEKGMSENDAILECVENEGRYQRIMKELTLRSLGKAEILKRIEDLKNDSLFLELFSKLEYSEEAGQAVYKKKSGLAVQLADFDNTVEYIENNDDKACILISSLVAYFPKGDTARKRIFIITHGTTSQITGEKNVEEALAGINAARMRGEIIPGNLGEYILREFVREGGHQ